MKRKKLNYFFLSVFFNCGVNKASCTSFRPSGEKGGNEEVSDGMSVRVCLYLFYTCSSLPHNLSLSLSSSFRISFGPRRWLYDPLRDTIHPSKYVRYRKEVIIWLYVELCALHCMINISFVGNSPRAVKIAAVIHNLFLYKYIFFLDYAQLYTIISHLSSIPNCLL